MNAANVVSWLGASADKARVLLSPSEFARFRNALDAVGGVSYLKEAGVSKFTAYQYHHGRRNIPLKIFANLSKDFSGKALTIKFNKNSSKAVSIPLELNDDVAYLAGAMRDGCLIQVKERIIGIALVPGDKSWEGTLASLLEKTFGLSPKKYGDNLVLYNGAVGCFFNGFLGMPLHSQASWETPKPVLDAALETKRHYIAGFFDAEGCCFSKGNDKRIIFYQNNWISLYEIKEMLGALGVECGEIVRDKRTRNRRITISKRNSLKRFVAVVPSRHPRKREKLVKLCC